MMGTRPRPCAPAVTGTTLTATLRPSRYTLSFTVCLATYGATVPSTTIRWPISANGGLPRARCTLSWTRTGGGAGGAGGAPAGAGFAGTEGGGEGAPAARADPAHSSNPNDTHVSAAVREGTLLMLADPSRRGGWTRRPP